jgi:hypothetical protein
MKTKIYYLYKILFIKKDLNKNISKLNINMISIFCCFTNLSKKDKDEIMKKRIQILPEYKKLKYSMRKIN